MSILNQIAGTVPPPSQKVKEKVIFCAFFMLELHAKKYIFWLSSAANDGALTVSIPRTFETRQTENQMPPVFFKMSSKPLNSTNLNIGLETF